MINSSPDTSAAEVVAWRYANADIDGELWPWSFTDKEARAEHSSVHEPLVPKALLDTSRAETAAAKRERDEAIRNGSLTSCPDGMPCERLCAYSAGDNKIMTKLRSRAAAANARAEAAFDRGLNDGREMRRKMHDELYEVVVARKAAEAKLAKAVEALEAVLALEDGDRDEARYPLLKEFEAAPIRAILTEIEGKSK